MNFRINQYVHLSQRIHDLSKKSLYNQGKRLILVEFFIAVVLLYICGLKKHNTLERVLHSGFVFSLIFYNNSVMQ